MSCENLSIPKPQTSQCPTTLFGIPYGAAGRTVAGQTFPISGIVIHCYDGTIAELCNEMKCRVRSSVISGSTHNSFHYGIGAAASSGGFQQHVEDGNISWTWGTYKNNTYASVPPPNVAINWPVLQGEHGINTTPDVYTIDIALAMGSVTPASSMSGCYECPTASGLQQTQHDMLVQMLAYLAQEYGIPIDQDHIQFHDHIACEELSECPCTDIATLLEEVENYCPPCEQEAVIAPEAEPDDEIQFIYGITEPCCPTSPGCAVKIPWDACYIGDLAEDGDLTSYILGLSFNEETMQWCLTRGCLAVLSPLIGCGTTDDPLRLDRCLFGDWLPNETAQDVINLVGIDDQGCLIEAPVCDVVVGCETHISVIDTNCIDLTVSGASNHTLQADIIISSCVGNLITCQEDGLCVQFDCDNLAGLFNPGTIVNLYGNDGAGACVVQDAQSVIEDAICLIPEDAEADPIWVLGRTNEECPVWVTPASVVAEGLVVLDTETVNLTLNDNVLSADVIISPAGDNILTTDGSGLYVPPIVANGSDCIEVVQVGQTFTVTPIIAPAMGGIGNILTCTPTGLYVPRGASTVVNGPIVGDGSDINPLDIDFTLLDAQDLCDLGGAIPAGTLVEYIGRDGAGCLRYDTLIIPSISVDNTDCIALDLTANVITATPVVSPAIGGINNILTCTPTGLFASQAIESVLDTDCVNLSLVDQVLTVDIIIDPAVGNQVSCGVNGLFVPLGAGITVADTDCIDLELSATGVITAVPVIAPAQAAVNNILECIPGQGLYVPENAIASLILSVADTDCITLNVDGGGELTANPVIAPAQLGVDNALSCIAGQGLYVPATEADFIIGTQDGDCTNIDVVGGVLTVDVVVAPTQAGCLNAITCTPAGLFAPQIVIDPSAGTTPAGGNIIGIDVDCDGVNDIEFCEGFDTITSGNTCATGAIGSAWAIRTFELAGKTLTVEGAPEHESLTTVTFANGETVVGPTGAPGTLIPLPATNTQVIFTNPSICRDMIVDVDFTGYGGSISVTPLPGSSTFSYAVQYEVLVNAVVVNNPFGSDFISTIVNYTFDQFEANGAASPWRGTYVLPPGGNIVVETRARVRVGITPVNIDLPNTEVRADVGYIKIAGRTTN